MHIQLKIVQLYCKIVLCRLHTDVLSHTVMSQITIKEMKTNTLHSKHLSTKNPSTS